METQSSVEESLVEVSTGPHSLGQSVEWKQEDKQNCTAGRFIGPTRWGNQLNGNLNALLGGSLKPTEAPLAGAIS